LKSDLHRDPKLGPPLEFQYFPSNVLNFVEKNRDSKILGGGTPVSPPPRKNILTASIFCQKSKIFFFKNFIGILKNVARVIFDKVF